MKFLKSLALVAGVALVSACSGGGGSSPSLTPNVNNNNQIQAPTTKTVQIQMSFTIPAPATTLANTRRPAFVSPFIQSAVVSAYQLNANPNTGTVVPGTVVTSYLDLSATSPTCVNNSPGPGQRTCTVTLPAPATPTCNVGTGANCDYFEFDAYSGLPSPSSPCGPNSVIQCTGVNGNQLSVATDGNGNPSGGNGDNGYNVTNGSNVVVSLGLQGLIDNFTLAGNTGNAQYATGVTQAGAPSPQLTGHPVIVLSGLGGSALNPTALIGPLGATVPAGIVTAPGEGFAARDTSGGFIAGTTCTNGDLFANALPLNDFVAAAGSVFATESGDLNATANNTQVLYRGCGQAAGGTFTSTFPNPTNPATYFPNEALAGSYNGNGGAGDEATTPPYFAYLSSRSLSFPPGFDNTRAPFTPPNDFENPPAGVAAYAHPSPLNPQPGPGAGTGTRSANVTSGVVRLGTEVVAPLFGRSVDWNGVVHSSRVGDGNGHVVLNLAGPGTSGTIWAAQYLLPSTSTGRTASFNGCTNVVTLNSRTDLTGTGSGWGTRWGAAAGTVASGGTSSADGGPTCEINLTDGFNNVKVWVFNSVATGSGTIIIGP